MMRRHSGLSKWVFDIDEISAGVYEVVARDANGCTIKRSGTDPEKLMEECTYEAANLSRQDSVRPIHSDDDGGEG